MTVHHGYHDVPLNHQIGFYYWCSKMTTCKPAWAREVYHHSDNNVYCEQKLGFAVDVMLEGGALEFVAASSFDAAKILNAEAALSADCHNYYHFQSQHLETLAPSSTLHPLHLVQYSLPLQLLRPL